MSTWFIWLYDWRSYELWLLYRDICCICLYVLNLYLTINDLVQEMVVQMKFHFWNYRYLGLYPKNQELKIVLESAMILRWAIERIEWYRIYWVLIRINQTWCEPTRKKWRVCTITCTPYCITEFCIHHYFLSPLLLFRR